MRISLNSYLGTEKQLFNFTNGFETFTGVFHSEGKNGRVWMTPLKKGGRSAPKICVKANSVKPVG